MMTMYKVVETYYDWDAEWLVSQTVAENLTEEEAKAKVEEIRKHINPDLDEDVDFFSMDEDFTGKW